MSLQENNNKISQNISKQMWQIAVPAVLANLSTPLLGLSDSFIMGHMSHERYLAAVALGAMLFSILYNGVNFLRMGTTGLSAQAHGRDDELSLNQLIIRGSISAAVIGVIFILLQKPIADLFYMFVQTEETVLSLSAEYFTIRIWGAPFALMTYVASGWLLRLGRAKQVLYIHLYMNVSNIANEYLIWVIVLPILSIWSFQLDGIFIGATAGSDMRNGMILSTITFIICIYTLIPLWGNHGLWASYAIFIVMRAITLAIKYPSIERRAEV